MEGQPIDYCGDPLQDFTLIRFLDRFVFRNPKQVSAKEIKGSSQRFADFFSEFFFFMHPSSGME